MHVIRSFFWPRLFYGYGRTLDIQKRLCRERVGLWRGSVDGGSSELLTDYTDVCLPSKRCGRRSCRSQRLLLDQVIVFYCLYLKVNGYGYHMLLLFCKLAEKVWRNGAAVGHLKLIWFTVYLQASLPEEQHDVCSQFRIQPLPLAAPRRLALGTLISTPFQIF